MPPRANSNKSTKSHANNDADTSKSPTKFGIQSNRANHVDPATIKATSNFHLHTQPSYLSSDSDTQDYRGLYNLGGIILVTMNARLVVENLLKYGILIDPHMWANHAVTHWDSIWPSGIVAAYVALIGPLVSYAIEVLYTKRTINHSIANQMHIFHVLFIFLMPQVFIWTTQPTVMSGIGLLITALIYTLKLTSYAHVSNQLRVDASSVSAGKKTDVHTPDGDDGASVTGNTTTTDRAANSRDAPAQSSNHSSTYQPSLYQLWYFTVAPTLIYQTEYPRRDHIRIAFCVRRLLEIGLCLSIQLFLVEQYILPTIKSTLPYMAKGDLNSYVIIMEHTLKLAIPNAIAWLLMFYSVFHSSLNLLAELIGFADRAFYKEWWNSQDLATYWRSWNLPVHHFMSRHVYAPALRHGWSPLQANFASFFVSAVLHEILISIPTHMISTHAFFGMIGQIPLIMLTRWMAKVLDRPVWGNVVFWISFLVFGQPLIILMYSFDYFQKYGTLA